MAVRLDDESAQRMRTLTCSADGQLCGGETERDFAERFAKAVWTANGGPCEVEVRATYLQVAPETAEWVGCRAYRDMEGYDPDCGEPVGFEYRFSEDDKDETWGRYLWLYAEEWGDVERVAHLVQRFLKRFRPDVCWALTYATVCSQPRGGEFGGGAVFVTAEEIKYPNAHEFVEQCRQTQA